MITLDKTEQQALGGQRAAGQLVLDHPDNLRSFCANGSGRRLADLYDGITAEFADWLTAARAAGILA